MSEIELKGTFFRLTFLWGFNVIYEMSSTVDESTQALHPHTPVSVNTVLAGCRYYTVTVNQLVLTTAVYILQYCTTCESVNTYLAINSASVLNV